MPIQRISSFEDIIVWQKAKELTVEVYLVFGKSRDFSFRDQIIRASISIMNNITEGYERHGNKEFKNFLFIAKGSCAEVRSMLFLALRLGYIGDFDSLRLRNYAIEISRMLSGFIKKL